MYIDVTSHLVSCSTCPVGHELYTAPNGEWHQYTTGYESRNLFIQSTHRNVWLPNLWTKLYVWENVNCATWQTYLTDCLLLKNCDASLLRHLLFKEINYSCKLLSNLVNCTINGNLKQRFRWRRIFVGYCLYDAQRF